MNCRRSILAWLAVTGGVLVPPLLLALDPGRWPLWFGLGCLSNGLVFYPALCSNCQWFGPVVTRFRTARKEVWLTIDDGPCPHDQPQLLELLRRHDARATFFVIGRHVRQQPELVRAILQEGHQLANHSETHPAGTFWCLPEGRLTREVDAGAQALQEITGQAPRLFRAPAGMANLFLHVLLREHGVRLIGWSARGYDGVRQNPESIVRSILRTVEPGAIILLHQGRADRRGNSISLPVLERLLTRLKHDGYTFTVPDEDRFLCTDR